MADAIYDPLSINLRRQTQLFLRKNTSYDVELSNTTSVHKLLITLSRLLAKPQLTELIATTFRPILTDLCARWIEGDDCTEEQLIAIAFLVEPQEELYPILDQILRKERFKNGPLGFITEDIVDINMSRLHMLLVAYFRILQANREISDMFLWPLMPLSRIIWSQNADNAAKLLAIRCYATQSYMGEAEREDFEREVLGEPFGPDCPLEYGVTSNEDKWIVDGWLLPIIERERVLKWRNDIPEAVSREGYYVLEDGESRGRIDERDLSSLVVNIHGVLLLRSAQPSSVVVLSTLIPTPSATIALRNLATHISLRLPTLLTSAPSAGKSLLLSHLACLLHPRTPNQLIAIHLADTSLDARSLLGSYVSSPTSPGTFQWKEGVLVRAMRQGRWVVFEDVDKASSEVLGTIRPLIESMRLGRWIGQRAEIDVPGKGKIVAEDTFRVFATRSVLLSQEDKFPAPVFLGAHKFWEVVVQPPTREELQIILDAKYFKLRGELARSLIHLWGKIRELGVPTSAGGRGINLRELEKFCIRVENLLPATYLPMPMDVDGMDVDEVHQLNTTGETSFVPLTSIISNPTLREDIFMEARDVFFGACPLTALAQTHMEAVTRIIGHLLGLDDERQEWLLNGRAPPFTEEKDVNGRLVAVSAGYTRLETKLDVRQEMDELAQSLAGQRHPFAMHRPAAVLLSRVARAVALSEPVLLVGETGTGKTSAVTHLAGLLRRKLVSLNLSFQTESRDLIGGFKPVDARTPASTLLERWEELFSATFSRRKNEKFEGEVRKAIRGARWGRVVGLWRESGRLALDRIKNKKEEVDEPRVGNELLRKRRKVEQGPEMWSDFLHEVDKFEIQHVNAKGKFAFDFVEGPLVKAMRSGDWILLDEINLASPETLECITSLLHGPTASITLTEQGSLEPVPRHSGFRLFSCMNPATDVGKKDLPPNIRSRFTEIDVPSPDADKETLLTIVTQYIGNSAVGDKASMMNVAEFYQSVKALAEERHIADVANHRPHYSMRTLTRALTFANNIAGTYGFPLRRALWEGCLMAFTMALDKQSAETVKALAQKYILAGVKNPKSLLSKEPSVPRGRSPDDFIKFGPFYLERGPYPEDPMEEYIITPSVEAKLIGLARIALTRRFPILIEGPTSSGKTSAVEYLAKRTGHRFVRINNHEHTDIQEYVGSYVSDPLTGKLVFKDGVLVRALRDGDWIVLDELNLAPTDVLEALNRLLDDNRELVISETQEVVRPHPHFMLFAAQNPPGLYAGRKVLSRAFRNRFLEVHFEDVPQDELETILCQRCRIAPPYGKKIVTVFRELQKRRQAGRVFESRHGFATLRDLFRWAGRDAIGYQELAENGYMLLAERARREDDKAVVKEVIEEIMGVKIDEKALYNFRNSNVADVSTYLGCPVPSTDSAGVVLTNAMQRLLTLVCRALRFNEPVLLVGETGSGKTSVCQVYADAVKQRLLCLNCHQNTETSDLIGGLRPLRNRSAAEAEVVKEVGEILREVGVGGAEPAFNALATALNDALKLCDLDNESKAKVLEARRKLFRLQSIFDWHDGPLIEAMRNGHVFLLDEISLADDSVLERLNSVLEPSRTIVLAEKGGEDSDQTTVKAGEQFKLIATMNPGGDYGKKELSPALRNRFTEIWVPPVDDRRDLELIVDSMWKHDALRMFTKPLLDFGEWLCWKVEDRSLSNLRDILAWVAFMNSAYRVVLIENASASELFRHAAHMTFLDGLGSLSQLSSYSREAIQTLKSGAESKLEELVPLKQDSALSSTAEQGALDYATFETFVIPRGPHATTDQTFNLQAPTTRDNAMRVVRACQLAKPILLEGSPGVGKTSLVSALANITGYHLYRINLSDQTDLVDLFGSDLPVEGGSPGEFAWRDAEFLRAMQEGHWVLLDEMNLAPQAVLEGLNAVLDHRGMVYIPELGRSFLRHPSFRIFAAQNPLSQGGGRKGLPKSFVNRFTKVYIEALSSNDLSIVCQQLFPDLDENHVRGMIQFNMRLNDEVCIKRTFGQQGSPWEFNLRDVVRWGYLLRAPGPPRHPVDHLRTVYLHRFRTKQDRLIARNLFDQIFGMNSEQLDNRPPWIISPKHVQFGYYTSARKNLAPAPRPPRILKMDLPILESIGLCVSQSWLTILTGPRNGGKTEAVRLLAHFTGNTLQEISINSATDTMDILGSYEQVDHWRRFLAIVKRILALLGVELRTSRKSNIRRLQEYQQSLLCILAQQVKNQETAISGPLQSCIHIVQDMDESPSQEVLLLELNDLISNSNLPGRFEWIDGPLVRSMKSGHWLLLDNANLCNPAVLDRLNSLCEPDGSLTLSEQGFIGEAVQIVKPHPDFRLFMTVDPQYGELSRAMRNRGIEISLVEELARDDSELLLDQLRYLRWDKHNEKVQCLLFDHARRCLGLPFKSSQSISSSGRALDQESALSYVIDQAPMVVKNSLSDTGFTESHLYFSALTTIPHYTSTHWRTLTAEDLLLRDLQGFLLGNSLRKSCTITRVISSDFASCQPMDFYLVNPSSINKPIGNKDEVNHYAIFQVLNFAVVLFLYENDSKLYTKLQGDVSRLSVKQTISETIDKLLKSIQDTSRAVLESLQEKDIKEQVGMLEVIMKVIDCGRHLRRAVHNSAVDHSTLLSLARCIPEALNTESSNFILLREHAQHFSDTVSLTSGLGLFDIWTSLYCDEFAYLPKASIVRIGYMASSLNKDAEAAKLRHRTLDYLSLATLPHDHDRDKAVTEFGKELECLLNRHSNRDDTVQQRQANSTSLVVELGLLSFVRNSGVFKKFAEELIDLTIKTDNSSLLRIVPYKQLIWILDAGQASPPVMARMHLQWLNETWEYKGQDAEESGDPSAFLHPTLLRSALGISGWKERPLSSLSEYGSHIERQARMTIVHCKMNIGRPQQLMSLLHQSLSLLAQCFAPYLPEGVTDTMSPQADNAQDISHSIRKMVLSMEQSSHQPLAQAATHYLKDVIDNSIGISWEPLGIALGKCWATLGLLLLDILVPNIPVDPAATQNSVFERMVMDAECLSAQITLHRRLEQLSTGNLNNTTLLYLLDQFEKVTSRLSKKPQYPVRNDLAKLHMYWSEIVQFRAHIVTEVKVFHLFALFGDRSEDGTLQEQVIQQSIAGFRRRLDSAYADFGDINLPLKLSLFYLQFGLRLAADAARVGDLNGHHKFASTLVAYPCFMDASALATADTHLPAIQHVVLQLAVIFFEVSQGVDAKTKNDQIDSSCQKAFRLWLIDRAKERERQEEANSLYRRAATMHSEISEAEAEERDFLALFPSFEDVLSQETTGAAGGKPQHLQHIQFEDAVRIVDIHLGLMGEINSRPADVFRPVRRAFLESLVYNQYKFLPAVLDDESLSLQLSILHDTLSHVQKADNNGGIDDFYSGPNIPETKKALAVVDALKLRLDLLLHDWPEQMVLHHLRRKCEAFLALSISSPVAKLLSGLEQLLMQTDDWEMYANKENTLKAHRQALSNIIIGWRRLELSSWRSLLDLQAKSHATETSMWWFRLYEACVYGAMNAGEQELTGQSGAVSRYLGDLIPLLDDYMTSSSLGQFQARLRLLKAFGHYLSFLKDVRSEHEKATLVRVQRILRATACYFDLFSFKLADSLRERKAGLEKEIQEFIKLASWKDINVQALKASARKTHHQLFKVIRKFREVLKQPVCDHLRAELAGDAELNPLEDPNISGALKLEAPWGCIDEHRTHALGHPSPLERTFSKYRSLVTTRIRPFMRAGSADDADSFAVEVISIAQQLSSVVIPDSLPPEKREKQKKALLVRKRKAWTDLLKELKRAGLSPTPKPTVLQNVGNECWLREQPTLLDDQKTLSTDRIEVYFSRLRVLTPRLRASLSSHHPDISTRELDRGIMLLESGYWIAIDLRRRLAEAIGKFNKLTNSCRRLTILAERPAIVASGSDVIDRVRSVKDTLCRLSGALRDVLEGMKTFSEMDSHASLPESIFRDVEIVSGQTSVMQNKLSSLLRSIQLTVQPILLADEYESIVASCRQVDLTREILRKWSQQNSQIDYIIRPVLKWIEMQTLSPPTLPPTKVLSKENAVDKLIESLLLIVQSMLSICPDQPAANLGEADNFIFQQYQSVRDFTYLLNLDLVTAQIDDVIANLASKGNDLEESLQRVIPFLDVYLGVACEQIGRHCQWTKALFKLDYVVCSVMLTLSEQGYCKPSDPSDAEAGAEITGKSNGVGLGSGAGTEDVSKEIEDESQVEGLRGESGENSERDKTVDDEDAIEMGEDIDGDMEDVPDEGTEDEGPKSDEESDGDPEERLGKLDTSDPSALDEKLWGDDQGPRDTEPEGGKAHQDHAKQQSKGAEVVGKEGKGEEGEKENKEEDIAELGSTQEAEQMDESEEEGRQDQKASGALLDDHIPEADILDLPEDLNFDDQEMGPPEDLENEEMEHDHDIQDEIQAMDVEERIEESDGNEFPGSGDEGQAGEITEQVDQEESSGMEEGTAQADISAGEGGAESTEAVMGGQEELTGDQAVSDIGERGKDDKHAPDDIELRPTSEPAETKQQTGQQSTASSAAGTSAMGTQEGQADSKPEIQTEPNPLRSLGDALKEIRQRFDEILDGEERQSNQQQSGDTSIPSQIEYLHPDDADHDMQALGPAEEEQVAKLNDLKLLGSDTFGVDALPMDLDATVQERHEEVTHPEPVSPTTEPNVKGDVEGAIMHDFNFAQERPATNLDPSMPKADTGMEDNSSKAVEMQLREWQLLGSPEAGGEHIWRSYEFLTQDLAYALCEQLRLILEPTLATRLKGDYRSGKRLNMKKIIPYIASDYTKDKIWLRRTRPSQREYQILIAIDDSRSMAETHSVHLAFQTLALVAKALSRLESGDVAIAKFGETVHMLHNFDEGQFTDQAGVKAISSFRFNQKATNVLSLVETSLKVLETARERRSTISATAGELWQLELIISDGLCQDHDRLRTLLRKSEEQRVMMVFIIVDSLHTSAAAGTSSSQSAAPMSILNMDKAEYKMVDGRMELQLQKYLDSFPFEYYVVLRNVEALPGVLAGTLKQFFERISES